jgi:hypothetical protein
MRRPIPHILLTFVLGGIATAVFSGSLVVFFPGQSVWRVLAAGLVIPSFTWDLQLLSSAALLRRDRRLDYWGVLGTVCLAGSVALLPAAAVNALAARPSPWVSVANVWASVLLMAVLHLRLARRAGFPVSWTVSWVVMICLNMAFFWYAATRCLWCA